MNRRYRLITPVHPEKVVDWFLGLHHYWFDESLGPNAFTGMRDKAEGYLSVWVDTGELPPSVTQLQIHVESKFDEWLNSSWEIVSPTGRAADPEVYVASNPSAEFGREPGMTRMGASHIKECRGCPALILWAKCVKKDGTIGGAAPLVKAKDGETPNIIAWFDEAQNQWFYKVKGAKSEVRGVAEYVNHFSNCPRSKDFKAAPQTESEQRQSLIK